MKLSILIVTRNWKSDPSAFHYINELNHSNIDFEVLLAEGNNPSSQRNLLAEKAEGEFILFLDDDSKPSVDLLEKYQTVIHNYPETEILGGPSLLLNSKKHLYPISNLFFSSLFGIGPVRSRYNSIGLTRKASERDLILSNLLMKKEFFLKTKGFNRNLYPGEENEFIKNFQNCSTIIYDPQAVVYREPRESFLLFLEQMFSYGKGRAKHFSVFYLFDYMFLIPMFFTFYILSLPFFHLSLVLISPLLLHFIFSFITLVENKKIHLSISQKFFVPLFFFGGHFSYGLGVMEGLFKYKLLKKLSNFERPKEIIRIHKLKNFEKSFPTINSSIK